MAAAARVVLVHGAATTPRVWDRVVPLLDGYDVVVPERPRTGSLAAETAWLASVAASAWVVAISGGATLGLALAASGTPLAGAVLHEPAVGSLLPGLLAPIASAYAASGTAGLGSALYGPSWTPAMAGGVDEATTAAELAMFRSFEPSGATPAAGRVLVTWGADSPAVRREAAEALVPLGYPVRALPGAAHFAAYDAPTALAAAVRDWIG
ncbi:MAG: alpha/beta fold hydrolase [Actinobacteria bacterium]|uniref:Unannotated protein n=1 Tax=freshwater metagenome TaxID=449393 RepID=A0A6J6PLN2_9ZZZZ|nr:alpha/beta fold hydrolase [Actinomycetota bacterium]